MERYVAALPAGLDSYPDCLAKGSVLRVILGQQPVEPLARRLPAPLRALVLDPPVDSEWMSEVHFCALHHAIAAQRGGGEAAMLAWVRERNRVLFRTATYRLLMAVAAPATMLRGAAMRWSNFHRGSSLEVEGVADDGVRALLRSPPGLFDDHMQKVFGEAFLAALEMARARLPAARITPVEPGVTRYVVSWAG